MERRRRVYTPKRTKDGWLCWLLLFLSAVLIFSGIAWEEENDTLSIERSPTPTPIPLDEAFDETQETREITLAQSSWYALQLGAFDNEESAILLGEQYARRGAAGYVWLDGRYRTLAAVYPLKEDAQNVRNQLREQHEIDTYLYQISLPSMQLRLSGMRGQLDILQAAFMHANELVASLQQLSSSLDRQEISMQETEGKLQGIGEQLTTVSLRLRQRFAAPRHETVNGLLECFDQFLQFVQTINPNESETGMGTQLKKQTFASLEILKQIYDSLSNT